MARFDSSNTAYSPDARGPRNAVTERWTTDVGGGANGTPAIVGGTVFLPTRSGLYALDTEDGEQLWRYAPSSDSAMGDPAVHDGVVYVVGDVYNTLSALDATSGEELWTRDDFGVISTDPFLVAGRAVNTPSLFIGTRNGQVHRLDLETGETTWQTDRFGTITAFGFRPDYLYVGTRAGDVFSYIFPTQDQPRGEAHRTVDSAVESILPAEGVTLVETTTGPLQFWKGNLVHGATRWTLDSAVAQAPPVSTHGEFFFAGRDAMTARRDYDQEEFWTVEGRYNYVAPVAAGDRLYVSSKEHVHGFALDGGKGFAGFADAEQWSYPLTGQVETGLAVGDGALFVAIGLRYGDAPTLHCLEEA